MNKKTKSTLNKMKQIMRVRNYSEQTIRSYTNYAEKFLLSFNKDVYHINVVETKNYLINYNYSSVSQQNQIINAVKFLFKEVVGKKLNNLKITRPRKEKRLPRVVDFETAKNNILAIHNLKHKAILSLAISTGLRVSEILNLKIKDIDSNRMLIFVRNGKGKKDRFVPLSHNLLRILRDYYSVYKPKTYLFYGQKTDKYSATSCNKIVKKYLGKEKSMHVLRHSYLTFLAENNVNISKIQKIAGHNSPKTSQIYIHLAVDNFKKIPSLL